MAQARTRRRRSAGGSLGDAIARASRRYRVPIWVLVGVKLIESGTGSGQGAVSSAGAGGPFQFMPETARGMGIRDVNDPYEAADGAARLLRSYRRKYGSWNAAFEAYNGGPGAVGQGYAYGESDVKAALRENGLEQLLPSGSRMVGLLGPLEKLPLFESLNPFNWFKSDPGETPLGKEADRLGQAGEIASDAASVIPPAIGDFFSLLGQGETWLRLLEVIGGAILLYLGLKTLTGQSISDLPGVRRASAASGGWVKNTVGVA